MTPHLDSEALEKLMLDLLDMEQKADPQLRRKAANTILSLSASKPNEAQASEAEVEAAARALSYGSWDDLPETGEGFEGPGQISQNSLRDDARAALNAARARKM